MRDAEAGVAGWRGHRTARATAACLAMAAVTAGSAGCAASAGASPSVQVETAYVAAPRTPGTTVAYVDIRNNGPADRLIAAHTSAGGAVSFVATAGPRTVAVHTITAVPIPAHAAFSMLPNGTHMIITGAGPMHGGKDITLTLVFAHAGPVSVVAPVTNSQSGGSSYFLN